jgi:hypothetical protein
METSGVVKPAVTAQITLPVRKRLEGVIFLMISGENKKI